MIINDTIKLGRYLDVPNTELFYNIRYPISKKVAVNLGTSPMALTDESFPLGFVGLAPNSF